MSALPRDQIPTRRMTVDEFLAWSETVPGRYELQDGLIVVLQSERLRHVDRKFAAQTVLKRAVSKARLPCRTFADGVLVRIDENTAYEPDALVYCGPTALDEDSVEVPNPTIVVEVLSPSTGGTDTGRKFLDYFRLPSVQHYLIIDPVRLPLIHHARQTDGTILSRIVPKGPLTLDPPGISFDVEHLFE